MALQTYIGAAVWTKRLKEDPVMYFVNIYLMVAIYFAVIVGVIVVILGWYKPVAADSRLKRMMLSCGIDEVTASNADQLLKLDMDAVRFRCRQCPVTDLCERWLNGEAIASNSFCPNVWYFIAAADSSQS
jgi:hypothetical protein